MLSYEGEKKCPISSISHETKLSVKAPLLKGQYQNGQFKYLKSFVNMSNQTTRSYGSESSDYFTEVVGKVRVKNQKKKS